MEDKDFLIVDLNGLDGALRALTAASDLIHICGEKTSCDLLVAESGQEIAEMSDLPRFVFTGPESEGGEETESKESGVGKFLGFAKRAINAVKLGPEALIVAKRIKQNKYDSAYALGSGGPGALIAKASGCEDIIGFAPSVESVVGAHALYNRAFPFPDKCPFLRVRKLIARSFEKIDPPSSPPLFGFRFDNARPDFLPSGHYVVAAGDLAAADLAALAEKCQTAVVCCPDDPEAAAALDPDSNCVAIPDEVSTLEFAGLCRHAEVVIGDGFVPTFAAAIGVAVVYLIDPHAVPPPSQIAALPAAFRAAAKAKPEAWIAIAQGIVDARQKSATQAASPAAKPEPAPAKPAEKPPKSGPSSGLQLRD